MPKLTITADEETLRRVRIEAAKRNMSVSRFVGEMLKERLGEDDKYERAMNEFFSRGPYLEPAARDDGRSWPTRGELYNRRIAK